MKKPAFLPTFLLALICALIFFPHAVPAKKKKKQEKLRVLLIDGQSVNHPNWKSWTPLLIKQLDESGLFIIDVATSPMKGESLDQFTPRFRNYDVVVSTYDGDSWPGRTRRALENYLTNGGGLVVVHAADNAFPDWETYNLMTGLGGWGNRTETAGPYVYIDDRGNLKIDISAGEAGHHGPRHAFVITNRAPEHPIMKDIPMQWLHAEDELYDHLRGPARNMEILATAFSSKEYEGSERNEPVMMALHFGEGRVFHTTLGHLDTSIACVGFITTLIRGCEWAATDNVTFAVPDDFPTKSKTSSKSF